MKDYISLIISITIIATVCLTLFTRPFKHIDESCLIKIATDYCNSQYLSYSHLIENNLLTNKAFVCMINSIDRIREGTQYKKFYFSDSEKEGCKVNGWLGI